MPFAGDPARHTEQRQLQALGLLAAGLAHDMNNLLAVIDGYAGMLQRQLVDPKMQAKLQAITEAAARATVLTHGVAAYRAQDGTGTCDFANALRAAQPLLKMVLGSRINLALRLPARDFPVPMDAGCVTELLLHLAAHARRALPRGQALTLELAGNDSQICLLVGAGGASPACPERVAGALRPLPRRARTHARPMAVGLPQVAELLRAFGGRLHAAAGGAVNLALVLPRAADPLCGKTVLVVDDEERLHPVLEDQLSQWGMRPLTAANAGAALDLQRRHEGKIDVLLTDLVMPETDGVRLAELMSDARPEIRVVYMTGYGVPQVRQMNFAGQLPDDALVVAKPLLDATLSAAMRQALADIN